MELGVLAESLSSNQVQYCTVPVQESTTKRVTHSVPENCDVSTYVIPVEDKVFMIYDKIIIFRTSSKQ